MDYEAEARAVLSPHAAAYFAAAAGSGTNLTEGTADWAAVRFRPRVLRDLSAVDSSTTVLGTAVRSPVLIAPMAQQRAAHPDGEQAMARAAAELGLLLGVSTNAAVPFADIAAAGAPWWFQVYVTRDRSLTELLVERAIRHGARALLLTVDMMALLPADVNPRNWPDGPDKARMTNLTAEERAAAGPDGTAMDFNVTFADIAWLRDLSGLPVLVKGVLRGDDARVWSPPTVGAGWGRPCRRPGRCRRWSKRWGTPARCTSTPGSATPSTWRRRWPWGPGRCSSDDPCCGRCRRGGRRG
jgi:4-hydroxymandelate oxidase